MTERREGESEPPAEHFVPRGAMAFMAFMMAAYGAIWFFFYFIMIGRP